MNTCQWIRDEGPWLGREPDWCGKPAQQGSPYCPEHHARCYMVIERPARPFVLQTFHRGAA